MINVVKAQLVWSALFLGAVCRSPPPPPPPIVVQTSRAQQMPLWALGACSYGLIQSSRPWQLFARAPHQPIKKHLTRSPHSFHCCMDMVSWELSVSLRTRLECTHMEEERTSYSSLPKANLNKNQSQAGEISQWVNILATMPEDSSSIPGIHMGGGREPTLTVVLWTSCALYGSSTAPHIHSRPHICGHILNKYIEMQLKICKQKKKNECNLLKYA